MADLWNDISDWTPRLARMERLGASVEELAREMVESIMGFNPLKGKEGHKPPRADIQKMLDVWRLFNAKQPAPSPYENTKENFELREKAQQEWDEKYGLDEREQQMVALYQGFLGSRGGKWKDNPQESFNAVVERFAAVERIQRVDANTDQIKREVGQALKKYEQQNWPMLFSAISNSLDDVIRTGPAESYKLWPRMVGWIKDEFQNWLINQNYTFNRPNQSPSAISAGLRHIIDITTEGGTVLNELRQQNKLPQNFDVNKINFKDFEEWLMDWKRENRASDIRGEVVYQFHDGWTVQKLTTAEELQYEGDELGHCVGSYAHSVESGETIIYSLRDPKDVPHVTMEIEALNGPRNIWEDGEEEPEDASYNHEPIHPDAHMPGDHREERYTDGNSDYQPTGEKPFEVVQAQGNGNTTPKPEYQRKIKEFLDALRAKGWKFVRSENWYAPHDDNYDYEDGRGFTSARDLDDWYDNQYSTDHQSWQQAKEDAYGLPKARKKVEPSWSDLLEDCLSSLVEDYDQSRWRGDWQSLAQAVYHAWIVDTNTKRENTPEQLDQERKNLLEHVQKAEETLNDWDMQNVDSAWAYGDIQKDIIDKFKELAEKEGKWPQIEAQLIQLHGEEDWGADLDNIQEVAEQEYEDLWIDARDAVESEHNEFYSKDAWRFCQYLIMLAEKHGIVNPGDLPNPNDRHGGLPSYEDLQEMPWKPDPASSEQTPVEKGLPGALSGWNAIAGEVVPFGPKPGTHILRNQTIYEITSTDGTDVHYRPIDGTEADYWMPIQQYLEEARAGMIKKAMAERTGDPELDALIDQFMHEEREYLMGGETDPMKMDYRDPHQAWGECYDVAEFLANWLADHGVSAHLAEDEPVMQGMPWTQEGRDPHPDDWGYADRPGIEKSPSAGPDAGNEYPELTQHHAVIVDMSSGRYMIDFTASQYGYKEFPMVQRLGDQGGWQREWTSKVSADEWETIQGMRVPFYWFPNGQIEMGHLGDDHPDILGRSDAMVRFGPKNTDWDQMSEDYGDGGAFQGHVLFHPQEGEITVWPAQLGPAYEEQPWVDEEGKALILAEARKRWQSRTSKVATPQVMYHVASKAARESILQHGLDWRIFYGDAPIPESTDDVEYGPRANYLQGYQEALDDAATYDKDMQPRDIWEVDVRGLKMEEDPAWYNGCFVVDPIGPERLRLLPEGERTAAVSGEIQIHPIDREHDVWFDEEGNERARYRPSWAKNPQTGRMEQTGDLEDSFLDKQGRQGEGWVAYHGDRPIGSLTYVDTPVSNMIGTTYVHPDYREQGVFNRLSEPLRSNGKPTDAYYWANPWLKRKVRSWSQ